MVKKCLKCMSDEYTNKSLVMLINECGHPLCRNCVENIFAGNANKCPIAGCGRMMRKNNYREQLFDNPQIERENFIRKRLAKTFNLQEDNFPSLRAFNDYLETYEDIIFKLANDIDVEETEAAIRAFKDEHAEQIELNRKRLTPDDIWINQMLDEEEKQARRLRTEIDEETRPAVPTRAIIEQLRQTDLPAEVILDRQRKIQIEADMEEKERMERKKLEKHERLVQSTYGQVRRSGRVYFYKQPHMPLNGPEVPGAEDLEQLGYLEHVGKATAAGAAGGFLPHIGCTRAIMEAHQDLFAF